MTRTVLAPGALPPAALRLRWSVSAALCLLYLVAVAVSLASTVATGRPIDDTAGPFMMAFEAVGVAFAVRTARSRRLDRRTRRAWAVLAASQSVLLASYVLYAVAAAQADPGMFPLPADWVRQAWPPLMLVGLLMLPTGKPSPQDRTKMALDIGTVLVGGAMLMWYLVIGPVLVDRDQPATVTAVALAFPLLDLALVFGAMVVLFRATVASSRGTMVLLATGITFMVVGDVYLGYLRVQSDAENHSWQFLCWLTSCFLMTLAARRQSRAGADEQAEAADELHIHPLPRLPYAGVALGYGLLLMAFTDLPLYPYGGLVFGALALTGLVVSRQIAALRQNHRLAVIDNLTGLANRALLRDTMSRAVRRSRVTGEPVAVLLIDLDKFKEVNDTLGHESGDEMLVAFAHLLERCVRGSDVVARLGGDEFAVVLHAGGAAVASTVADRISAASRQPVMVAGQPVCPSASIGIAVSDPATDDTVNGLLHRADVAMYTAKRSRAGASPAPGRLLRLPS
ncbi:MAG TPA: GGDEF domain-containing protein [Pilimelia sp.]|nr:GGDEF domain-containing protein [Pilimelia sp.]